MSKEYHLGYFEGIRNALLAFQGFLSHEHPDFETWLSAELKEAAEIRGQELNYEEWEESDEEIDPCICIPDEPNLACESCF
tara:strand:- start:317 stop:559 length:243 start_codon:yes stop_codon:yes gene_type:complete